jgi:hypothetical protein
MKKNSKVASLVVASTYRAERMDVVVSVLTVGKVGITAFGEVSPIGVDVRFGETWSTIPLVHIAKINWEG